MTTPLSEIFRVLVERRYFHGALVGERRVARQNDATRKRVETSREARENNNSRILHTRFHSRAFSRSRPGSSPFCPLVSDPGIVAAFAVVWSNGHVRQVWNVYLPLHEESPVSQTTFSKLYKDALRQLNVKVRSLSLFWTVFLGPDSSQMPSKTEQKMCGACTKLVESIRLAVNPSETERLRSELYKHWRLGACVRAFHQEVFFAGVNDKSSDALVWDTAKSIGLPHSRPVTVGVITVLHRAYSCHSVPPQTVGQSGTTVLYGTMVGAGFETWHVFAPSQKKDSDFNTLAMFAYLRHMQESSPADRLYVLTDSGSGKAHRRAVRVWFLIPTMARGRGQKSDVTEHIGETYYSKLVSVGGLARDAYRTLLVRATLFTRVIDVLTQYSWKNDRLQRVPAVKLRTRSALTHVELFRIVQESMAPGDRIVWIGCRVGFTDFFKGHTNL